MTLTENIMEICRVRTEYEIQRYLNHADFLPEQLTYNTAHVIIQNVKLKRNKIPQVFIDLSEKMITLGKWKV